MDYNETIDTYNALLDLVKDKLCFENGAVENAATLVQLQKINEARQIFLDMPRLVLHPCNSTHR
jgi:hypothetical protein